MDRKILYRHRDNEGTIEVVQERDARSLYFGSPSKQSSVRPEAPHELVLPYTRTLAAALLFRPEPRRILLVGLGGGALAHFFLHHFPEARVEAVENRAAVVAVARDFFALPLDHPRLTVHLRDAGTFLAEAGAAPRGGWDLVVADAYNADGPDPATLLEEFYLGCRAGLHPEGVLAANLWSSRRRRLRAALEAMERVFGAPVYRLQARGRANVSAFARQGGLPADPGPALAERARALEERIGLAYERYLTDLEPHRRTWLDPFIP
ncbi:MAG: hypothetical protein ACLFRB_03085 [Thiohalorhabdus sp.]|uniref:spermine/spermidine synthase domain-containing protein n=1 Tax=Thiohalorhabdus sp. TaxID=3094134 RepID=UPI00398155D3